MNKLLSLCCGALPEGGSVRTHVYAYGGSSSEPRHMGHCSVCGEHTLFAPGGELATQPRWLKLPPLRQVATPQQQRERQIEAIERGYTATLAQAARERQLRAIERRSFALWVGGAVLCAFGIALAVAFVIWRMGP